MVQRIVRGIHCMRLEGMKTPRNFATAVLIEKKRKEKSIEISWEKIFSIEISNLPFCQQNTFDLAKTSIW